MPRRWISNEICLRGKFFGVFMKIKLTKAGELQYVNKPIAWKLQCQGYETTWVAGHELRVLQEGRSISLGYMGYEATGFSGMAEAKNNAPEFVLQVFDLLKQRALDFPAYEEKPEPSKVSRHRMDESAP